jgi:hypothetical protein
MKRKLILFGNVAAFVFLADGVAMILSRPTSTVGGVALVSIGGSWLALALPRLVDEETRPFLGALIPKLGLVTLPILFLPISGLWFVATPTALTPWFAAAWAGMWLACLVATFVVPCPSCGTAFGRIGLRVRPLHRTCAQCGAGPVESRPEVSVS